MLIFEKRLHYVDLKLFARYVYQDAKMGDKFIVIALPIKTANLNSPLTMFSNLFKLSI